jgi:TRAP-type C4-dicarboxylate transport system substrate-binding protein
MKKNLRMIVLMVLVISMLALTACSGGAVEPEEAVAFQERTWKVGHVRPENTSTHDDTMAFAEALNAGSEGNITLEVYPASQLGNYTVVQERVSLGDIEMQLAPLGTSVNKGLGITSAPYLVSTWDEAREAFARDGKLMTAVDGMLVEQKIKLLASYPKYFGGIALAVEPDSPEDPNVDKGIKIRVPGMKQYEMSANALGFIATPIAYSEAFTSMQTGIVDGVIGSGAEGYYASFRDLTKFYLPVNDHFEMWFLYMSLDTWDDLSQAEQDLVMGSSVDFETARYAVAEDEQAMFEQELRDLGIVVYDFTDAELAVMKTKIQEEVWPEIKDEFGAELFDSIVGN